MGRGKAWSEEDVSWVKFMVSEGKGPTEIANRKGWPLSSTKKLCANISRGRQLNNYKGSGGRPTAVAAEAVCEAVEAQPPASLKQLGQQFGRSRTTMSHKLRDIGAKAYTEPSEKKGGLLQEASVGAVVSSFETVRKGPSSVGS